MRQLNENYSNGNNIAVLSTVNPSEMGQIFSYNGNIVTMRVQNGTVYVNLTEFAKPFPSKNLTQIINSQEIKEYCNSLSKLQNYSFVDLLIVRKGAPELGGGTWAHQKVALRVAQKLSTDFAIWVDTKIEELLTTGVTTASNDDEAIAYAMQVLNKRLEQAKAEKAMLEQQNYYLTNEIKQQAPKVQYVDNVLQSVNTYATNLIAKEMGMSAETLNKKLKEKGIQYRQSGVWVLTSKYQNKGYTKTRTHTYTRSDGSQSTTMLTVWTEQGREFLHSLFKA
ncbi:phage antirepressor KilAC domain-containing protein [Parabacteroides sp. APC149_11_2_Y6]